MIELHTVKCYSVSSVHVELAQVMLHLQAQKTRKQIWTSGVKAEQVLCLSCPATANACVTYSCIVKTP